MLAAAVILLLRDGDADRPAPSKTHVEHEPHVEGVDAHDQPDPPAGVRPEEAVATRAARRFLDGYLPYTYGAAPARELRSVTPQLRRELAKAPPRVPATERDLEPRVVELELLRSRGDIGIDLEATVDDGKRLYPVGLGLRSDGERWLVVAVW